MLALIVIPENLENLRRGFESHDRLRSVRIVLVSDQLSNRTRGSPLRQGLFDSLADQRSCQTKTGFPCTDRFERGM